MMIGLVALAVVPTFASAGTTCDPTFTVCAGEYGYQYGSCSSGFGYSYGYDYVSAWAPTGDSAYAEGFGFDYCGGSYTFSESGIFAGACDYNTYTCAQVGWFGYSDSYGNEYCTSYVYTPAGFQDVGCPAGSPPNPGWGMLGLP